MLFSDFSLVFSLVFCPSFLLLASSTVSVRLSRQRHLVFPLSLSSLSFVLVGFPYLPPPSSSTRTLRLFASPIRLVDSLSLPSLLSCSPFFLFFSKLVAAADALPENGARRPRKQDHGRPADDDQGQRHRRAGTGRTWTCLRLTLPAFAHDQPWTGCMPGRRLTPP